MSELWYCRSVKLDLDNLTVCIERELYHEFDVTRAQRISDYMHDLESEHDHQFSPYQDKLWHKLTLKIEDHNTSEEVK